MAGPSKRMHVSDEVVLCELLENNKCSDISESECNHSDMNMNILSCSQQSFSCNYEVIVSDNGTWTKLGSEGSHFHLAWVQC
jgi:hypothetical protein